MNNHYLLISEYWGNIFIPEDEFKELFELKDKHTAQFKENLKWHPMSGGADTYIQSYCLMHARSSISYGECKNYSYNIIGIYKFEF